jgi:hypothetical protein
MPLSYRLRGNIYHVRGTIRVGTKVVTVASFSTGARTLDDAEAAVAAETARIRDEILDGPDSPARRLTIADAFAAYLERSGGSRGYDIDRVALFNVEMGDRPLLEAAAAWQDWLRSHPKHAPATVARNRNILLASLRYACKANGLPPIDLPGVKQPHSERVVYLSSVTIFDPSARPVRL